MNLGTMNRSQMQMYAQRGRGRRHLSASSCPPHRRKKRKQEEDGGFILEDAHRGEAGIRHGGAARARNPGMWLFSPVCCEI